MSDVARLLKSNPFSTHRVRPGLLEYRFEAGQSFDAFFTELKAANWRGQIVGPHGSGKSTLLCSLANYWSGFDRKPLRINLNAGQRSLPKIDWSSMNAQSQLIVDGYEQLSLFAKSRLVLRTMLSGVGILVTSHGSACWLAKVHETRTSKRTAIELETDLVTPRAPELISPDVISHCYDANQGDIRETFMMLFDKVA